MGQAVLLSEAADESAFGGKAASLSAAIRFGLPVPAGYVLSVDSVEAVVRGEPDAMGQVAEVYACIVRPLAVRSSAVGEDSAHASFAGQHLTRLGIRSREGVLDSIRQIWESARARSALAYRQRLGISGPPRMAVILQELIVPDCAGVLFTRNPVNRSDELMIEASWGLGEAVVAGLVEPDRYRVSRTGEILEQVLGRKDRMLRVRPEGGTEEFEVDAALVFTPCLDERRLLRLHQLVQDCEKCFGGDPQDLEWAYRGDSLYLLQRRAVTRVDQ